MRPALIAGIIASALAGCANPQAWQQVDGSPVDSGAYEAARAICAASAHNAGTQVGTPPLRPFPGQQPDFAEGGAQLGATLQRNALMGANFKGCMAERGFIQR